MLHNNVALGHSNDQVNSRSDIAETMHEVAFIRVIQIINVRGFKLTSFDPIYSADYTQVMGL